MGAKSSTSDRKCRCTNIDYFLIERPNSGSVQVTLAKNRSIGYNPDKLITLDASIDLVNNYNALKDDLLITGQVEAVAKASSSMTWASNDFTHLAGKERIRETT